MLEVKTLQFPELTPELLQELGGFELAADLRDTIKDSLGPPPGLPAAAACPRADHRRVDCSRQLGVAS